MLNSANMNYNAAQPCAMQAPQAFNTTQQYAAPAQYTTQQYSVPVQYTTQQYSAPTQPAVQQYTMPQTQYAPQQNGGFQAPAQNNAKGPYIPSPAEFAKSYASSSPYITRVAPNMNAPAFCGAQNPNVQTQMQNVDTSSLAPLESDTTQFSTKEAPKQEKKVSNKTIAAALAAVALNTAAVVLLKHKLGK